MTAPAGEVVEQEVDCDDQLGHWMCAGCNGEPVLGRVYKAHCGVRKVYRGPAWGKIPCRVCEYFLRLPCEKCAAP